MFDSTVDAIQNEVDKMTKWGKDFVEINLPDGVDWSIRFHNPVVPAGFPTPKPIAILTGITRKR